jgi:hypothetical protein
MGVAYWLMLRNWLGAVDSLADYQVRHSCHMCPQASDAHTSATSLDAKNLSV